MVERRRKNQLPERIQDDLIQQFVADATARTAADLVGVNRHTAPLYFHKLREVIALMLDERKPWLSGETEIDENYFGASWKGKSGRGAAGKVPIFGLLKRRGKASGQPR